jgi:spore maturation protein CgeB
LSKLTVNITHFQSRLCGGLNLRVFEAMSTGTVLVNDRPEEIGTMFEEGAEFLSYRSEEELRERCAWVLASPGEARRIAEAGRRAVLSSHTLQHRLVELLRTVEES